MLRLLVNLTSVVEIQVPYDIKTEKFLQLISAGQSLQRLKIVTTYTEVTLFIVRQCKLFVVHMTYSEVRQVKRMNTFVGLPWHGLPGGGQWSQWFRKSKRG